MKQKEEEKRDVSDCNFEKDKRYFNFFKKCSRSRDINVQMSSFYFYTRLTPSPHTIAHSSKDFSLCSTFSRYDIILYRYAIIMLIVK